MQTKTVRRTSAATGGTVIETYDELGRLIKVQHFGGKVYGNGEAAEAEEE